MMQAIDTYLSMRRAAGFELKKDGYLLHSYARFVVAQGEKNILTSTAINWASQTVSVAQRDTRLKAVCRFARYIRYEDNRHELPPADYFLITKRGGNPISIQMLN